MFNPGRKLHFSLAAFVMACSLPGLILACVTWIYLRQEIPTTPWDAICVRDYLNLWAAGRLAHLGEIATLFHPGEYFLWLRSQFGRDLVLHTWSYPPPMALLAIPLAMLPLVPGFIAWTAGTLAVLVGVLRRCGLSTLTCLAVACSPAVIESALAGQNGALTATLLEGGLLLAGRRPAIAGVLLGLLTTKPHLGLLIPICLLASGNWKAISTACITATLLFVASSSAFGVMSWVWYLTDVRHFMTAAVLERPYAGESPQKMMVTPFILARGLGASLTLAYALQLIVAAGCAVLAWRCWRRPDADPKARTALTAALALLATPYCYAYDMIGVSVGIAMLAGMAVKDGFRPGEASLLALAWIWPGAVFWTNFTSLPPLGCLPLAGVAYCAWRRLAPQADPAPAADKRAAPLAYWVDAVGAIAPAFAATPVVPAADAWCVKTP